MDRRDTKCEPFIWIGGVVATLVLVLVLVVGIAEADAEAVRPVDLRAVGAGGPEPWAGMALVRRRAIESGEIQRPAAWWMEGGIDSPGRWRPAPDASWHGPIDVHDARFTWVDAVSVRHVDVPGRGRWSFVLDAGRVEGRGVIPGGAKLVALSGLSGSAVDAWWLDIGHAVRTNSRLQDFLVEQTGRYAVLHDAGTRALVVIDLVSRRSWRSLAGFVRPEATLSWERDPEGAGWLAWSRPESSERFRVPMSALSNWQLAPRVLAGSIERITGPAAEPSVTIDEQATLAPTFPPLRPVVQLQPQPADRWWRRAVLLELAAADHAWVTLAQEAARGATGLSDAASEAKQLSVAREARH